METNTNAVRPVPCAISLEQLSDEELLSGTRRLVGRSNQLLASLVAHLGEVEARGIVQATCPVRELAPGDRPRDWMQAADESAVGALDDREGPVAREGTVATTSTAPVQVASIASAAGAALARIDSMALASDAALARIDSMAFAADAALATLARVDSMALASDAALGRVGAIVPPPLAPERYKVQFTATEEYVRLVDQAKALLSHAVPRLTLEELQLRALRALVAELTKKKYATLDCSEQATSPGQRTEQAGSSDTGSSDTGSSDRYPARASLPEARAVQAGLREQPTASTTPRQRGRHIPAAVRRAVFERDGQHCSYVAATGKRCFETNRLEFHHLKPFAAGGEHAAANLTLRCAAHNALAAEEAFGRGHIEATRGLDS